MGERVRKCFQILDRFGQCRRPLSHSFLELVPDFAQIFHCLLQRFLGVLALGNVPQGAGKTRRAMEAKSGNRQLDGKFGSIPAHRRELDSSAKHRRLASRQVVGQSPSMGLAQSRRND